MTRLLKSERMKTRGCYLVLTALALTALGIAAGLHGDYKADAIRLGWRMYLYQLPLVNAVFLPLIATVTASRLCGIEHKGGMLKQLCCLTERGRLFDAKLIFGLLIMTACVLIMWGATVLTGMYLGFEGEWPVRLYLYYLLFTIAPTIAIYIFQHTLSLCLKNQAAPFFIGIGGEAAGLFSMFLPQLPWLRRSLLWGYYGALQFVGLFDWTKETRYQFAHFDLMPIDWTAFGILAAASVGLYIIGRAWFKKKEI